MARRATRRVAENELFSSQCIVEQVSAPLKDLFALARQRAKTLGGRVARLAAKVSAFTTGDGLHAPCGRPLRQLAALLV